MNLFYSLKQKAKLMAHFTHHSQKNHLFIPSNFCLLPLYVAPPYLQITFKQILQHERRRWRGVLLCWWQSTFWMQMAANSRPAVPGSLVLYILFIFLLSSFNFALKRPWRALSTTCMILMASSWLMFLTITGYRGQKKEVNKIID